MSHHWGVFARDRAMNAIIAAIYVSAGAGEEAAALEARHESLASAELRGERLLEPASCCSAARRRRPGGVAVVRARTGTSTQAGTETSKEGVAAGHGQGQCPCLGVLVPARETNRGACLWCLPAKQRVG